MVTDRSAAFTRSRHRPLLGSMPRSCELLARLRAPARLAALDETQLLDTPPEESLDRLTRLARELVGAPIALFTLVDDRRVFIKSSCGLPESLSSSRDTPLSHSLCQFVVGSSEPLIIADTRNHPLVQDSLAVTESGIAAYLGVPVAIDGQVLGVLCLADQEPRTWTERQVGNVRELARCLVTELELRRLVRSVARIERAREQQQRLLSSVVESIEDPILVTGLDGQILIANETARRHQTTSVQCISESGFRLPDGSAASGEASPTARACRGESLRDLEVVLREVGQATPSHYLFNATPLVSSDGVIIGAVSVGRDVTEIRDAQLAREVSEGRYRAVMESLPNVSIAMFDHDLRFLMAEGEHVFRNLGLSKDQIVGRTVDELVSEENRERSVALYRETLAGRHGALELCRGDRTLELRTAPVRDAARAIVAGMVMTYDVTAHKEVERALREQTHFMELLHAITASANVANTREGALQSCIEIVLEHLGWAIGHVYLREGDVLVSALLWAFHDDPQRPAGADYRPFVAATNATRFARGCGLLGTVLERREPRTLRGIGSSAAYVRAAAARVAGLQSTFAFPVMVAGEVGAVIEFCTHQDVELETSFLEVMSLAVTQIGRVLEREAARAMLETHAAETHARSLRDELTGLYNRRGFMECGQAKLARSAEATLFFIDLNGMKRINDELGHEAGDRALVDLASLLREAIGPADLAARLGGDEFVVLALASHEEPAAWMSRLRKDIASFNARRERPFDLSVSIGKAACTSASPRTLDELLCAADALMYEEKHLRRLRGSLPARAA